MKLNNGEIFVAREPLQKLLGQKFPVKVAYGLAKMASKLNDQFKVIDDVRNGLIKTCGDADPENPRQVRVVAEREKVDDKGKPVKGKDGKPIMEANPKFQKFAEEMNELFAQEVEVVFDKVKLPEKVAATCDKCNHNMDKMLEIEPSVLVGLEKFVEVG